MTIRSYQRHLSGRNVWLFPALFVVVALLAHWWSGALRWPIDSADHQRDFNTALGITLFTAFFWAGVRAIHQNVASTLIAVLLDNHQLSQFNFHRRVLIKKFERQLSLFCCLAPIMPFFYLVNQGLVSRIDEAEVFMITLSAIPFWLFVFLFIAQVTTNTRYIFNLAFSERQGNVAELPLYRAVFDMAIANAKFALGAIAILPVFWFNKPIPLLDVVFVSLVVGILVLYLFVPVWRICQKLVSLRAQVKVAIEGEVSAIISRQTRGEPVSDISAELETLYQQRDQVIHFVTPHQRHTLLLSGLSLPFMIFVVECMEHFLLI